MILEAVVKRGVGGAEYMNSILVSYVAKGILPYRGLGSGIKRALEDWPEIDFTDYREGNLFVSTVRRVEVVSTAVTKVTGEVHAFLQVLSGETLPAWKLRAF